MSCSFPGFSPCIRPPMSSREVANACASLVFVVLFKDAAVLVFTKIDFLNFFLKQFDSANN